MFYITWQVGQTQARTWGRQVSLLSTISLTLLTHTASHIFMNFSIELLKSSFVEHPQVGICNVIIEDYAVMCCRIMNMSFGAFTTIFTM